MYLNATFALLMDTGKVDKSFFLVLIFILLQIKVT